MTTVSHGLCVCRSEAGDPAALRFSMTHNINHFIEVGQILLEIHLKCGGTAQAGGRHCAWERLTKPPHAAGSVSQQQHVLWLKTPTESRQDQRGPTSRNRWREWETVGLSCTDHWRSANVSMLKCQNVKVNYVFNCTKGRNNSHSSSCDAMSVYFLSCFIHSFHHRKEIQK